MHPRRWLEVRPEGLHVRPAGLFVDPVRPVPRAVVSHGHSDHARAGHGEVWATPETLAIMRLRLGEEGAGPLLVFRRITLPFLAPTAAAAAGVAFLQSFENYNTTVFAIGGEWTLVTEVGSRFRFGLSPALNALGVLFVLATVAAALAYAALRERARRRRRGEA